MKVVNAKRIGLRKPEPSMLERLTEQIREERAAEEAAREAPKSIQKAVEAVEKLLAGLGDSAKKLELLDKLEEITTRIGEREEPVEKEPVVREWQFDIKRGSYGEIVKVTATPIP